MVLSSVGGTGNNDVVVFHVYHDNGSSYTRNILILIQYGSTTIRSSADNELFGLGGLTSGGATEFKVRVISSQSFSDSYMTKHQMKVVIHFTTQSFKIYQQVLLEHLMD